MTLPELQSRRIELTDSLDQFQEQFLLEGWGDGLPLVPPTEERVRAMLGATTRDPAEMLGPVPPKGGLATVEKVAINAVMAGCLPAYFPVVLAAVEAVLEPRFNLNGVQATTHGVAPLIVIGGPVVGQIGANAGGNLFGQGNRANATIGRALRLVMTTLGGGVPGKLDQAVMGHPGKHTFCIAESPDSPWPGLHEELGVTQGAGGVTQGAGGVTQGASGVAQGAGSVTQGASGVTVFGGEAPHSILASFTHGPRPLLYQAARSMATLGCNNVTFSGQAMLVINPEFAEHLAAEGWTKADVRQYLYEKARLTVGELKKGAYWHLDYWKDHWPKWIDPDDNSELVPIVQAPADIHIVVGGGRGKFMAAIPGWGALGGLAVARAIRA